MVTRTKKKKTTAAQRAIKRAGVKGLNKPKLTPKHPKKKGVVVVRDGNKVKTIRFGAKGYGHNYSSGARKSFKARHGKNIKKGKTSAAYWADKVLWAGKSGKKKSPPKGQRRK